MRPRLFSFLGFQKRSSECRRHFRVNPGPRGEQQQQQQQLNTKIGENEKKRPSASQFTVSVPLTTTPGHRAADGNRISETRAASHQVQQVLANTFTSHRVRLARSLTTAPATQSERAAGCSKWRPWNDTKTTLRASRIQRISPQKRSRASSFVFVVVFSCASSFGERGRLVAARNSHNDSRWTTDV